MHVSRGRCLAALRVTARCQPESLPPRLPQPPPRPPIAPPAMPAVPFALQTASATTVTVTVAAAPTDAAVQLLTHVVLQPPSAPTRLW